MNDDTTPDAPDLVMVFAAGIAGTILGVLGALTINDSIGQALCWILVGISGVALQVAVIALGVYVGMRNWGQFNADRSRSASNS